MIARKLIDFYAHQSGVKDLDFTLMADDDQEALTALYEVFNRAHHGVTFSLDDEFYETDDGFGMEVQYRHAWNSSGKFRLQVSKREKPTLDVMLRPMVGQLYFKELEFEPFEVPCLESIEMAAEKVRAAFQRAKVRDLYDLHLLSRQKFVGELLRALVVLKLWQARDPFDAETFFRGLRGSEYDWEDLKRLLRPADRVEQATIISNIETHYAPLKELTELQQQVVDDARKGSRNEPLAEKLRGEIRERFARPAG